MTEVGTHVGSSKAAEKGLVEICTDAWLLQETVKEKGARGEENYFLVLRKGSGGRVAGERGMGGGDGGRGRGRRAGRSVVAPGN